MISTGIQQWGSRIFSFRQKNIHKQKFTQSGQSTIEFLLCFIFALGIMFLFVKMSFQMADGYLTHYATYMASRTYLVLDDGGKDPVYSDTDPAQVVKKVFEKYHKFIPRSIRLTGKLEYVSPTQYPSTSRPWYVGVIYKYKLDFKPPGVISSNLPLTMDSESFLGREPTIATCLEGILRAFSALGCTNPDCVHATFTDDGC
jgi:hypothetical protein